jgi:hypothetical protein
MYNLNIEVLCLTAMLCIQYNVTQWDQIRINLYPVLCALYHCLRNVIRSVWIKEATAAV